MKTLLCSLTFAAAATMTVFAQGRVWFNNEITFNASDAITIGSNNMGTTGGLTGEGIGGDKYSVQLLWIAGTGYDQASFDAANPHYGVACTGVGFGGTVSTAFIRNTGSVAEGAGYFNAGNMPYPPDPSMTFGWYTMQVLAWYDVGYSTYESARAGSANVGKSQLFRTYASVGPGPAEATVFPGFTVGTIPEPSTLALAGLGAAAMLLLRRKRGAEFHKAVRYKFMKTLLCSLTFAAAATLTVFAQGRVQFQNVIGAPDNPITIGSVNMGTAGGLAGEGIGGDKYSVQLIWVAGTGYNQATFDAANPTYGVACTGIGIGTANAAFITNTGPVASGAGFFDAGQIPNPSGNSMPVGRYTMQVLAWYNVGYSTYESARLSSANVGRSQLFVMNVSAPAAPIFPTIFSGFSVGTIPEPSTLALAGLGAVAMLLLDRAIRGQARR